ncbi:MAG: hypothetical protein J6Q64_02840, partial [Clostridia bacterium]|nr:hypothetical protein [Clostridia bacterium]
SAWRMRQACRYLFRLRRIRATPGLMPNNKHFFDANGSDLPLASFLIGMFFSFFSYGDMKDFLDGKGERYETKKICKKACRRLFVSVYFDYTEPLCGGVGTGRGDYAH